MILVLEGEGEGNHLDTAWNNSPCQMGKYCPWALSEIGFEWKVYVDFKPKSGWVFLKKSCIKGFILTFSSLPLSQNDKNVWEFFLYLNELHS